MKTRRGLSSVVGAVFAVIAITSSVAYVSYSMNVLNQYNNAVLVKNQQLGNTADERFQISSVGIPNSQLNVTLTNTGPIPINFTKIWVQNTSATNWIRNYTPPTPKGFVSPGATLTNLGQNIGVSINPAYSYNVKLVTSRGTSQAFSVNSASAAPLNIQFMFIPDSVASGFNTELVMIVTNNSTGTLTNISPASLPTPTYTGSGTTSCTASSVSPAKYSTLAPGSTAIFKWDVTVSGYGADTCTYTVNQPLQNGYSQTLSATATVSVVQLSNSNYAADAGVVTSSYTSFHWTEGSKWNTDWSFPNGQTVDFYVTITNNNQTGGGYNLWLSKNTQMYLFQTLLPSNGKIIATPFFIVSTMPANPPTPPTLTGYSDNSVGIPNQGGSATIYFGAQTAGSSTQSGTGGAGLPSGTYFGFILIYGKFTVHPGDNTGGQYAQALPFMAVVSN